MQQYKKNSQKIFIAIISLLLIISSLIYLLTDRSRAKYFTGTELKATNLELSDSLGLPTNIAYINKALFIIDASPISNDNQVKVYDPYINKYITSFGKNGSGPGEYTGLWSISQKVNDENILVLYDLVESRITMLQINNLNNVKIDTMITLKEGTPLSPVVVNDSTIFSNGGSLKKGRYAEYDFNGNLKEYVGELLPGKRTEVPVPIHQEASIGKLKVSPDGKHIVLTSLNSDYIDIYNNIGSLVRRIEGPKKLNPQYNIKIIDGKPKLTYANTKTILCYIDATLTNNRIFALFSGEELHGATGGSIIHVFDMKGDFVKTYTVKEKLGGICIDHQNKRLYALQNEPVPDVLMYNLE
ncbi:MAG: hypothetical protein FD143_2992 [Ignavibacteria bacterium]|nr:MAG: hypothetical protein FD143_2992 [Ignavibacteria bacterium]KAF0156550.1 MAG: hypothetical protein FD188_2944 [Ignavibacteria bacterium]